MKNIDLTSKILINEHFQISLGRFLFILIVTILQFLIILCMNCWTITPESLMLFLNMMFTLEKRYDNAEGVTTET